MCGSGKVKIHIPVSETIGIKRILKSELLSILSRQMRLKGGQWAIPKLLDHFQQMERLSHSIPA
jgi:hypothetical protein